MKWEDIVKKDFWDKVQNVGIEDHSPNVTPRYIKGDKAVKELIKILKNDFGASNQLLGKLQSVINEIIKEDYDRIIPPISRRGGN